MTTSITVIKFAEKYIIQAGAKIFVPVSGEKKTYIILPEKLLFSQREYMHPSFRSRHPGFTLLTSML